jgi:two-component system, cell cycle sensor histidine kinase PleC
MHVDGQRASSNPTGTGSETGPEAALARCLAPAWVIDPAQGRVLAANPAGAARLGLHPDAASGALDAAMPGLVRLRALLHEPLNGGRREPLIFWTAYGAESLVCNVNALGEAANTGLVLVSIAGAEDETLEEPPLPLTAALPQNGTPPSSDDAATMKKIARAIRTGFAKGSKDATAPTQAETPSVDPDAARAEPAGDDLESRGSADPESSATSTSSDRDTADTETGADSDTAAADRAAYMSKLAHEIRTPLSAIVVAAEIMKDERFGAIGNEKYRSYSADIHDNARHALEVINRLLGDTVPDAPVKALKSEPLDLNALAESSVSAMRPLAEEAGLALTQELHSRQPRVVADAMSIKQILFNLLANAIKFTGKDGEVRVVTGLGFDRSIFVAVQDTGPGMSTEEIAHALNSEAPPKPERKEAGGLGIGLPLAQSLAKANGARLEIDSTPGEGTVVALIFPKDRVAPSGSN